MKGCLLMNTSKKLLSVILAVVFVISSFAAGFSVSAAEDRKPIKRVDITLRTDLAGKSFWDRYDEIFFITSEHVDYPTQDINGTPLRIFETDGSFANDLVPGKKYEFEVYVQAEDGWYFADDVEVYINGEESAVEVQPFSNSSSLYINCGVRKVKYDKSIGFFTRVIMTLKRFFKKISGIKIIIS